MEIKPAESVPARPVAMDGAEKVTMRMLIGPDQDAPTFNMRMFDVAAGGHTPQHEHPWEHEVFVLSGRGEVRSAGGAREVSAGVCVYVPPGEKHQFANTGDEPMRFLCLVPKDSG